MRTLIFGAKGQLGRDLMQVFEETGEIRGYDLPEVDVAEELSLQPLVADFSPDLIINAAAYTNVEQAEDDLEAAFRANEIGARHLTEIAASRKIPIVYYSTDYVFNGQAQQPYKPEDPTDALGVYGKSKLAGEVVTRRSNPFHFILRTAWLYGPGGNNFVEKILQAARQRPSLKVVADEVGSPTHTLDLAQATLRLCRTEKYGVYHGVNSGQCSRFEFAQAILKEAGIDIPVEPCRAAEFPSKAPRPAYSVLDNSTLHEATGVPMRSWEEALTDYMQRRKNT